MSSCVVQMAVIWVYLIHIMLWRSHHLCFPFLGLNSGLLANEGDLYKKQYMETSEISVDI
jgi:hypothetical protein